MKSFLITALVLTAGLTNQAQAATFNNSSINSSYPQKIALVSSNLIGDSEIKNEYLKIGTGYKSKFVSQLETVLNTDLSNYGVEGSAAFIEVNSGDEINFKWSVDSNERDFFSDRFYFWDGKSLNNFGGRFLAWNRRNSYRWYSHQFTTTFIAKSNKIGFLALDTEDAFGDTELRINKIHKIGINPKFVKTANEPNLIMGLTIVSLILRGKQLIKRKRSLGV